MLLPVQEAPLFKPARPPGGRIDHTRERLVALLAGLPNFQGLAPLAVPGCSGLRAPCQLKLTSADGLLRGATRKPVYDSARLTDMAPTRLFVDATTTSGWRDKGFYPVLNEQGGPLDDNLEYSLLYDMIRLGREHPLPVSRWDATGLYTCTRSFPASNSHP